MSGYVIHQKARRPCRRPLLVLCFACRAHLCAVRFAYMACTLFRPPRRFFSTLSAPPPPHSHDAAGSVTSPIICGLTDSRVHHTFARSRVQAFTHSHTRIHHIDFIAFVWNDSMCIHTYGQSPNEKRHFLPPRGAQFVCECISCGLWRGDSSCASFEASMPHAASATRSCAESLHGAHSTTCMSPAGGSLASADHGAARSCQCTVAWRSLHGRPDLSTSTICVRSRCKNALTEVMGPRSTQKTLVTRDAGGLMLERRPLAKMSHAVTPS